MVNLPCKFNNFKFSRGWGVVRIQIRALLLINFSFITVKNYYALIYADSTNYLPTKSERKSMINGMRNTVLESKVSIALITERSPTISCLVPLNRQYSHHKHVFLAHSQSQGVGNQICDMDTPMCSFTVTAISLMTYRIRYLYSQERDYISILSFNVIQLLNCKDERFKKDLQSD